MQNKPFLTTSTSLFAFFLKNFVFYQKKAFFCENNLAKLFCCMKKTMFLLLFLCCVASAFPQANISFFQTFVAGNNVVISWETTNENQIATFKIEQVVGETYTIIGEVVAKGSSNSPVMYNFSDMGAILLPSHCYRIKVIDTKGNFTYITSDSACVKKETNLEIPMIASLKRGRMKVNATASGQKAAISMPKLGKYTLVVYDLDGKKIGNVYFEGIDYELDVSHYLKSTYYIETTDMRNVYVEKFTVF